MPDDKDVLEILGTVTQLRDAQLWEIANQCRAFRARADDEDQTVEIEVSRDSHNRYIAVARDPERDITAQGVPMPGINGAIQLVPWYMLDE